MPHCAWGWENHNSPRSKVKETAKCIRSILNCCPTLAMGGVNTDGSFILSQYFKGFKDCCCLGPGCCARRPYLCSQIWVACAGLPYTVEIGKNHGGEVSKKPANVQILFSEAQPIRSHGHVENPHVWQSWWQMCPSLKLQDYTRLCGVGWGKLIRVIFETTENRERSLIPCN